MCKRPRAEAPLPTTGDASVEMECIGQTAPGALSQSAIADWCDDKLQQAVAMAAAVADDDPVDDLYHAWDAGFVEFVYDLSNEQRVCIAEENRDAVALKWRTCGADAWRAHQLYNKCIGGDAMFSAQFDHFGHATEGFDALAECVGDVFDGWRYSLAWTLAGAIVESGFEEESSADGDSDDIVDESASDEGESEEGGEEGVSSDTASEKTEGEEESGADGEEAGGLA